MANQNLQPTLFNDGISASYLPPLVYLMSQPGRPHLPPRHPNIRNGWDGNAFYNNGKRYVVAISPENSKNGLHELRTYRFDDGNTHVPEGKLTTIVTEPLKVTKATRTTGASRRTTQKLPIKNACFAVSRSPGEIKRRGTVPMVAGQRHIGNEGNGDNVNLNWTTIAASGITASVICTFQYFTTRYLGRDVRQH